MRAIPTGPLHPLHVPRALSPLRLLKWCEQRTRLDARRAARKGKPLSHPDLRRRFQRRLIHAGAFAPDIVEAILRGDEPNSVSLE